MISVFFTIIIYALVLGLVVWLVHYLVDVTPIAPPFGRIAKIAVTVVAVLIMVLLLLSLVDSGPVRLPRL
jgi:hypothetical protein